MFVNYEKIENIVSVEVEKIMNDLIAGSLNDYLENLRNVLNQEQNLINKTAADTIEKIKKPIENLNELEKNMSTIQNKFYGLELENKKLIDEIRKRDAIIERKSKQLQKRIKNEV